MKLRTHVLRYAFSQYTYQITNTVISFRSYDIIGRLEKKIWYRTGFPYHNYSPTRIPQLNLIVK